MIWKKSSGLTGRAPGPLSFTTWMQQN